ncbi:espin isoform X1 [Spodoptera frugiperda]|uniref:Espin isoform X1 n=3 Tax=Spodoptera frugiperda TaxID=7108 RepID=A0A9R0D7Y1_SPOFR|nr:espin isoform X1 [Spodoptera frugiperda]XP_035443852.2 espin isoform X1 [Spodoptera frugiperda]
MPRERSEDGDCNAIARLIKDFCSCSENATWSPEMTSDRRKGPLLKSELTNMSAMRRRIISIAKRKNKEVPEPPKLTYGTTFQKNSDTLTSNLVNTTISSQSSTLRRNIDNFLLSRRMFALEEDIYEKPIQVKTPTCGENWSLSKAWRNNNSDFFNRSPTLDSSRLIERNYTQLERIDEIPQRKKRNKKMKEQIRYDRNIKRHIRIRVMLSLRMRRYMKRRMKKPGLQASQNVNVPPRRFPRGASVTSSFGTRSYRSVMTDKLGDGAVLFDIYEARNSTMELCHDYEEDLDTLQIALRAGNFRSGRLAVEGWWCGRAMPGAGGRANNGALALHYAAARGCLDCVRLLTNTTPDVSANTAMDNDVTPVYLAAQEGHLAVLKYLVLEAGGRLDARARDGMLPIHAAAQTGCLDCVKWMIVERGVDPNARDGDGATPLHFAASRGHLSTVRWLLRHGARLHLDRHGKSPINDAAENHHLECLNVLVAAGAAGADNKQLSSYKAIHSCACAPGEARCALPNCINMNGTRSPFYLHAPERERRNSVQERRGSLPSTVGSVSSARSGPADGLYVNPMQRATSTTVTHHSSSGEESSACSASDADNTASGWFLHNNNNSSGAPAALYQRVRDLFHTRSPGPRVPAEGQEAPAMTGSRQSEEPDDSIMTVKAEIHGSAEATTAQEQSDSDSGAEATRRDHHYEDIYVPREEHQRRRSSSRDSGSHSRPGSAALVVDYNTKDNTDTASKAYEEVSSPVSEAQTKSSIATKLAALTHKAQNFASRLSSAAGSRRASVSDEATVVQAASASSGVSSGGSSGDEAPPPPPPPPAPPAPPPPVVLEEPALKPSELRGRLAGRRGSAASADDDRPRGPNLVNKQAVLPFVPPAFPHNAPDRLIKPSEYLKTITAPCKRDDSAAEARPPPPPPVPADNVPPPPPQPPVTAHQPLAAISSAELSAVRLRTPATKTLSAPPPARSVSLQCLPSAAEIYKNAKTDLIEELKMSKDITGIKKLKVERARRESLQDKETFTEFTKRFTAENFVEQRCAQVPERDAAGNVIPAWKRQMLARRAAEKARKDLEKELAGEAERRRAAAVPAWKRQLLQRREEAENRLRNSLYTPKVEETNGQPNGEWRSYPSGTQRAVSIDNISMCYDTPAQPMRAPSEAKLSSDHCNGHTTTNGKHEEEEEKAKIIPWRAQLRKTNSKLNLLE